MKKTPYELGSESADHEIQHPEELELQEDLAAPISRSLRLHCSDRRSHG